MKDNTFQVVVVAAILFFHSSLCAGEDSQLSKYVDRKCTNPSTATKVKEATKRLEIELDRAFGYVPDNMEHFCKNEKGFLINLMKEVAEPFKACVSHEEAYLPDFAGQSFVGFMHFMCHNYSEHVRMIFSLENPEAQNCIKQLRTEAASQELDNCFSGILGPTRNVVIKSDLCNDIHTAKRCFSRVLDQQCPGGTVLPKLNERLFRDLMDPCQDPSKQKHKFHQPPQHSNHVKVKAGATSESSAAVLLFAALTALYSYRGHILL